MDIKSHSSLIEPQLKQLETLLNECYPIDTHIPEMHWSFIKEKSRVPSIFYIEKNNQIIGFLKVLFFYKEAVEIILLVTPNERRKKVASTLLNAALPLFKRENINALHFSYKTQSCDWLTQNNAQYDFSAYALSHTLTPINPSNHKITLATHSKIKELLDLDQLCFPKPTLTALRIEALLVQEDYDLWMIQQNNTAIAKLHIRHFETHSEIYDVAVHPQHQHKGYATSLINHALETAKTKQQMKVTLDVASHNSNALSLYLKCGFNLITTHYYWRALI